MRVGVEGARAGYHAGADRDEAPQDTQSAAGHGAGVGHGAAWALT
jgi:hypothetical protein